MAESTGNIFLDTLDRLASWDYIRTYGLPVAIDGGRVVPVANTAPARTEKTPPAAPGAVSSLSKINSVFGVSNGALLAAAAGLGLILVLK